jgi:hypothetical protein
MAPRVGFEPTTLRLTAECSTAELSRNTSLYKNIYLNSRQRPTLPGMSPSTIGAGGLNLCVRDGNRCFPSAMATENFNLFCLHLQNYTVRF